MAAGAPTRGPWALNDFCLQRHLTARESRTKWLLVQDHAFSLPIKARADCPGGIDAA